MAAEEVDLDNLSEDQIRVGIAYPTGAVIDGKIMVAERIIQTTPSGLAALIKMLEETDG